MIKTNFIGANRTQKTNINTILSIIFRGGSIILQFALIPLTIDYIKPDAYGVWITLSSLVGWISMFDIGIANGLKNKLSESLAKEDYEKGRLYVSTSYFIIGGIALILFLIYFASSWLINWQTVFNSDFIPEHELSNVVTVVTLFFLLKFVSDIINVVASSFQMVSISSLLLFISNLGLTLSIWILTNTTKGDLLILAFILSVIPFIVSVVANFYLFNRHFNMVKPALKYVDLKESKSIMSLGSQFFILQLISLIIFQTDNILITQLFHPLDVTNFNVAYKYFSVITILFTIIVTPYWTAFTEAYHKKDFKWITSSMNKLYIFWILGIFGLIIMVVTTDFVISLWIGPEIKIPLSLSISICCYVAIANWNAILASFLNGVGKLRIQMLTAALVGVVNVPLSLLLVKKFNWGTYAMPASNAICLTLGAVICYVQYNKLINNNAKGIWNK